MNSPTLFVAFRHPDRGAISPVQTEQLVVVAQSTPRSTKKTNSRIIGGPTSTPGEESSKMSTLLDSSSKAPAVCDPIVPTQRLRQTRRSSKPFVSGKATIHGHLFIQHVLFDLDPE